MYLIIEPTIRHPTWRCTPQKIRLLLNGRLVQNSSGYSDSPLITVQGKEADSWLVSIARLNSYRCAKVLEGKGEVLNISVRVRV